MTKKKFKPEISADDLAALIKASESGVVSRNLIQEQWKDTGEAIRKAKGRGLIATYNDLIYDPERLEQEDVAQIANSDLQADLPDFAEWIRHLIEQRDIPALALQDVQVTIGDYFTSDLLEDYELTRQGVRRLNLKLFKPFTEWYYLQDTPYEEAYDHAIKQAEIRHEQAWRDVLAQAGEVLRPDAQEGDDPQSKALARLYSRNQAEKVLHVPRSVLRRLLGHNHIPRIMCPDGAVRFRAEDIERLRRNPQEIQAIEDDVEVNSWQVRMLTGLKFSYIKTLLHNAGVRPTGQQDRRNNNTVWYRWGDVRRVFWPEGDHPSVSDMELIEESGGAGAQAWWSEKIIEIHRDLEEKRQQRKEAKDRRRGELREQRDALRNQMIDNFPSWLRDNDVEQTAFLHVGPTNSGKTHDALVELANAGSGWYLAPLRLLAREVFEKLNRMGVYCSLLTGEERVDVPGATFTAATVEMFNPATSGECVVIDESHLVADDQRGWAWTQALVNAQSPQVRVITAPHGLNLLSRIFESTGIETQILNHHRLVPLDVAPEVWGLDNLPERTILVAFSRRDVLRLKYALQQRGRSVAVVYGALPPEVRLKQAERFAGQEVEICVATDAVGMGLNLPADNVVFSTLTKFDGKQQRRLTASELQQIGGRAGRYGFSNRGFVGGIDKQILDTVKRLLNQPIPDVEVARLAPRTDEIELLEGDLAQRLMTWQQLNAIPDELRDILTSTDMADRIELAKFLSYKDLQKLSVDKALTLVNAPVRAESQEYWVECATSILNDAELPLPPASPKGIREGRALKQAEMVIACIDVYLWLAYRRPFEHLVSNSQPIIDQRAELTHEMDLALMRKFNPNTFGFRRDPWFEY